MELWLWSYGYGMSNCVGPGGHPGSLIRGERLPVMAVIAFLLSLCRSCLYAIIPTMKTNGSPARAGKPQLRSVVIVAYDGIELLDATGPVEVFETVNKRMRENGETGPPYVISILAERQGIFATSGGLKMVADAAWQDCPEEIDTLLVVGSTDGYLDNALANKDLLEWLRQAGGRARRLVSVCTGAFLLAEAGLLDGRRATTHWMYVDRLRDNYPKVVVDPDAIYVRDGSVSTSAGVTTCMDLALSLVEEDFGRKTALAVARRLVLYLKRPGGQTQFSTHLRAQMAVDGPLGPLLAWLEENVHLKVKVEELAERAAMSPRNFARTFVRETGMPPARYIDLIRLERATRLLEDTTLRIEAIAQESGFASAEQLRRTFQRRLGITPLAYRERF
jgi:transcriptional regulator GlxA family with amidase domain